MAESLYLKSAEGRAIGLVTEMLDTACSTVECPPLEERWGLDTLWWSSDDRTIAASMKNTLLRRAGSKLSLGTRDVGNSRVVPLNADEVPPPSADTSAWIAFRRATGTVGVLRFSPTGFSRDGRRALVVIRMLCGPRCGHWLGASLVRRDGRWNIAEVLLIASDHAVPRGDGTSSDHCVSLVARELQRVQPAVAVAPNAVWSVHSCE